VVVLRGGWHVGEVGVADLGGAVPGEHGVYGFAEFGAGGFVDAAGVYPLGDC
jgi:hypothetical protein